MPAIKNHAYYNDLPYLESANMSRQAQGPFVDDIINGPIRDVFLKHGAHITFCLSLLHRHYTITASKAIAKVESTPHLMHAQAIKDIISFGNKIVPTTWMAFGGEVLPMEYAVIPAATAAPVPTPAFLLELLCVLAVNGCTTLFGIDTIANGGNWCELRVGDVSVVVPSNDSDGYDQDRFIPVAFVFEKENPKFRVHGKCSTDYKHS